MAKNVEEPLLVEVDFFLPESHAVPHNANEDGAIDPKKYNPHHTVAYNTTVAVVRINPDNGAIELLNVSVVADGGQIINPDAAATQIESGIIMGSAYGLTSNFKVEKGFNVADTLGKTKIPRINEIAKTIDVMFCEAEDPTGPFGSKGVAEIGGLTPAPAICNAIYDAVGVRVKNLPAIDYSSEIKEAVKNNTKKSWTDK